MVRVRASKSATLRASAARYTAGEFCCAHACAARGLAASNRKNSRRWEPERECIAADSITVQLTGRYLISTTRSSLIDGCRAVAPIIAMYFRLSTRQVSSDDV